MSGIGRFRFLRTEVVFVLVVLAGCFDKLPSANGTIDVTDHAVVTVPDEAKAYDHDEKARRYHLPGGAEMSVETFDDTAKTCVKTDTATIHTRCADGKRVSISMWNDHSDDRDGKIVEQVAKSFRPKL